MNQVLDILRQAPVKMVPDIIHKIPDDDGTYANYFQEWYQKNRAQQLVRIRNYANANKEKIKAKKREWYEKNKARERARIAKMYKTSKAYREARKAAARKIYQAKGPELRAKARARYAAKKAAQRAERENGKAD